MNARNHVITSRIAHAMAYIDMFMTNGDTDDCELKGIFEQAHTLSSQEVVSILKEMAKRSKVYGIKTILKEMDYPEFERYINRKLNQFRQRLMDE